MTLVVDASTVVTALIGGGAHGKWAKSKLRNGGHLVAPAVMTIEATNALRRLEARGRLDPSAASTYFADLQRLRVEVVPFDLIADRIWQLRGNVTSYDASYVAVAELVGAPLATLDMKLVAAPGPACHFAHP
jgi:predicted nucleic acid-binding protein